MQRHLRQTFYATDVTVVVESKTLMCFDALMVASSGCLPEVCGIGYMYTTYLEGGS